MLRVWRHPHRAAWQESRGVRLSEPEPLGEGNMCVGAHMAGRCMTKHGHASQLAPSRLACLWCDVCMHLSVAARLFGQTVWRQNGIVQTLPNIYIYYSL